MLTVQQDTPGHPLKLSHAQTHYIRLVRMDITGDPEAFILEFERVAEECQWPKKDWPAHLAPLLSGESLAILQTLPCHVAENYDQLKKVMLEKLTTSEEMYRKMFRSVDFPPGAKPKMVAHKLSNLGRKWLKPSTRSTEEIVELIVVEQFIGILPEEAKSCLSNHLTISLDMIVRLIEEYFTIASFRPKARNSDVRTVAHELEPLSEGFETVKAATEIKNANCKEPPIRDLLNSKERERAESHLAQIRHSDVIEKVDELKDPKRIHQPDIVQRHNTKRLMTQTVAENLEMLHPMQPTNPKQRESTEKSESAFVTTNCELVSDTEKYENSSVFVPSEADLRVADELSMLETTSVKPDSVQKVRGCKVHSIPDPQETEMTEVVDQSMLNVFSIKAEGDGKMEELEDSIMASPELEDYKVHDESAVELALVKPDGELKMEESKTTSIRAAPDLDTCEVELVYIGHEDEVKMEELEDPCLMGLINPEPREAIDKCKVEVVVVKPEEWENSSIFVNPGSDSTEACSESSVAFETVYKKNLSRIDEMERTCSIDFQDSENKRMSIDAAFQEKQGNALAGIAASFKKTSIVAHSSNISEQVIPGHSSPVKSQTEKQRFVVVDNRLVAVSNDAEETIDKQNSCKEFETMDQENVPKIDKSCSMDFQNSEMSVASDCQKKQHNVLAGIAASFGKTSNIAEQAIHGDSSPPMKSQQQKQRFVVRNNLLLTVTDGVEGDSSISAETDVVPRKKCKTQDYHEENKLKTLSQNKNESFKEVNVIITRTPKEKKPCICTEHTHSSSKQITAARNQQTLARENSTNNGEPGKKLNMLSTKTTHQDDKGEKQNTCNECGKHFTYYSSLHKHQEQTGEKPDPCAVCEKTFNRLSCLLWHQRTHTCGKPHTCSKCGKSFKFKSNLDRHQQEHIKAELPTCSVCDRTFKCLGSLHRHEHIHKGPYPCSQCDKTFELPSSLRHHERVHNEYKPYLCIECGETFKNTFSLHRHEEDHIKGKSSYSCVKCGEIFKDQSSLLLHKKKHTAVHCCKECGKCFVFASTLHAHSRKHRGRETISM